MRCRLTKPNRLLALLKIAETLRWNVKRDTRANSKSVIWVIQNLDIEYEYINSSGQSKQYRVSKPNSCTGYRRSIIALMSHRDKFDSFTDWIKQSNYLYSSAYGNNLVKCRLKFQSSVNIFNKSDGGREPCRTLGETRKTPYEQIVRILNNYSFYYIVLFWSKKKKKIVNMTRSNSSYQTYPLKISQVEAKSI